MPFGILAPSDHYFLQQNHIKWMVQDTITAEEEKCNAYYHFVNQTHHGLLIYYVFFLPYIRDIFKWGTTIHFSLQQAVEFNSN